MVGAILPRPIAFVSTIDGKGVYNLAPYSFFTGIAPKPPVLGIGIGRTREGRKKDTLVNIEQTREFVISVVTEDLAEKMNQSAAEYPPDVDEFKMVGLTPVQADFVKSPLVAESPVNMECRLIQILEYGEFPGIQSFVIGEVIQFHIEDRFWVNGEIQSSMLKAIGRMGGDLYCRTRDIFEMKRPVVTMGDKEG